LQLFIFWRHTKTNFLCNDLLFSIAYFTMFCKVLGAVLKHPVSYFGDIIDTKYVQICGKKIKNSYFTI
jgi:hypothetical protein